MGNIAQEMMQVQSRLEADRSTFENHWAEIAPLVLPRQDEFFNTKETLQGERRTRRKFDDTATLALERGSAAIEGILIPRGQKWHGIKVADELEEDQEANEWADEVRDLLFRMRYASSANFASQAHEFVMSLLAFGTGIMAVEDDIGRGIRYKSSHLSEHYIMENSRGIVDTTYRKYRLTARQASQKFKEKTPAKVKQALEKEPNRKMEFLHVVMPDEENDTDFDFVSYHISIEDRELIDIGGFKSFPYIVSRWVTAPNETYGRSPAMQVLSEIKMLNQMRKTDLRARHMAAEPPVLAPDQKTLRRLTLKPNHINYGTVDINGRPLVMPFQNGANISLTNDILNQSREVINDAFFLTLFQILVETPAMTATEVLQRAQEKGMLLSPTAGRQMTEWLGPLIEREITLLEDYGIFEDDGLLPMPESVKELGGQFEIEYTNPLARMQASEAALATERTIQSMLPLAQIDPSILDRVDWNEYADIMRESNGAPAKLFKSDEELAAEQQAKQQQQAIAQVVDAAPQVAGAVKDIAQAQNMGTT